MPTQESGSPAAIPADPYREWASLTCWLRLKPNGQWPKHLSFVVERSASDPDWSRLRPLLEAERAVVPLAFDEPLANGRVAAFATLRLATTPGEPAASIEQRIGRIAALPAVVRLQLGYPRGAAEEQAADGRPVEPGPEPLPADVVIGLIDDGCPFAHPALQHPAGAGPRVALVWQQTTRDAPQAPWRPSAGFAYGRVLDRTAMIGLMQEARRMGRVDEGLLYQLAYTVEDRADPQQGVVDTWPKPSRSMLARASHGASVLALAAAPVRAAYVLQDAETRGHRPHGEPWREEGAGEPASRCPLVCVDLAREQVEISSGRWMPVSGLDGLRFILSEARRRFHRGGEAVPLVVNLSSGAFAGAHAGEAMFERAMDELLHADDRLAITLAAGNSRESDAHASLKVDAGATAEVGLFVPPSQPFDTCVELWLPPGADLSRISVEVTAPTDADGAASTALLQVGGEQGTRVATLPASNGSGKPCAAALLLYPSVVQATGRTMALLAIAGTTVTSKRRDVPRAGPWRVRIANRGSAPVVVQAWIERDEVVFGQRRDQIARFFCPASLRLKPEDERPHGAPVSAANTLSNIATGERAMPVGAFRGRALDSEVNGRLLAAGAVARYSGQPADPPDGEPRRYLPFAAVADAGQSHPGIRAAGNRGDTLRRMNGTSAAAPQGARYMANAMAAGLTRSQVAAGLPAKPAGPSPHPADGRKRL